MQKARAAIILLTAFLTALTAIGMELMPVAAPPADNHADPVMHEGHHGEAQPGHGDHHQGPNDCPYCQLAKATDLPPLQGPVTVHRRLLPGAPIAQTEPCHLRAWTLPRWPRAPPKPDVA